MTCGTHDMLAVFEVKGDTTEASASDSEMPACAVRKAPQSFAPSPHIPTHRLRARNMCTALLSASYLLCSS